jgi:hypothetical protein
MTSLAISRCLAYRNVISAASTSRIGMGVVIVGTIFSLVLTLLLFLHCTLCGRELKKHYPEFEHIEEYEKKQNKMKIIKLVTAYFVLFSLSIFNANAQQLLTIEDAVKMH